MTQPAIKPLATVVYAAVIMLVDPARRDVDEEQPLRSLGAMPGLPAGSALASSAGWRQIGHRSSTPDSVEQERVRALRAAAFVAVNLADDEFHGSRAHLVGTGINRERGPWHRFDAP